MRWLAALLLMGCAGADLGAPRFTPENCRTVEIVDADTGKTVVGAEDLALASEALWVSAYDRVENQSGGVYLVELTALAATRVEADNKAPGFRPHGIAARHADLVFFVNRPTGDQGLLMGWSDPGTQRYDFETETWGAPVHLKEYAGGHCALNDLALRDELTSFDEGAYGTTDRLSCDAAFWERVLGRKSGRVISVNGRQDTVLDRLNIPNGIAYHDGAFWVAEMGERRLIDFDRRTIDLPGAPDNLNSSSEGIVAALQPSLWRFGLYRYGYTERAPTRIVLVDPETEEIELLYDDPKGRLLSGATVAVLTSGGTMVASSVRGDRLLVCEPGRE